VTSPASPGKIRPAGKETVLVADDDKTIVLLLSEFLRKNGFNVAPAFDAMQAMVGVRQAKPKAVILDIGMPGGTGMDVLRKLKAMTTTTQIVIIILTGSTDEKLKDECLGMGADAFLTKPPNLPEILATLKSALGHPDAA
jgi:two-component system OmpR family response regulator